MSAEDIVDKLKKFPIAEWEEARLEILALRDQVAKFNSAPATTTVEVVADVLADAAHVTDNATVIELNNTVSDLKGQLLAVGSILDEAHAKIAEHEATNTDLAMQLAISQNDLEQAKATIAEVSNTAPASTTTVVETIDIDTHPAVTSLRDQVSSLRSELMDKTISISKLNNDLTTATVANNLNSSEIESLNKANNSLQSRLAEAEEAMIAAKLQAEEALAKVGSTISSAEQSAVVTLKNIFLRKKN